MGSDHARILASQVPGARVQALFDADPTRAKAIADETGARVVTADPAALIQDSTVDAVLVATPDHVHTPSVFVDHGMGEMLVTYIDESPAPGADDDTGVGDYGLSA